MPGTHRWEALPAHRPLLCAPGRRRPGGYFHGSGRAMKKGGPWAAFRKDGIETPQAAIEVCGAAERTSESTWPSKRLKFSLNMSIRRLAVSANSALFCQVFTG